MWREGAHKEHDVAVFKVVLLMSIGHLSAVLKIDGCGGVQEPASAPDELRAKEPDERAITPRPFMEFMSIRGHSLSTVARSLMQGTTSPGNRWEMKVTGGTTRPQGASNQA